MYFVTVHKEYKIAVDEYFPMSRDFSCHAGIPAVSSVQTAADWCKSSNSSTKDS